MINKKIAIGISLGLVLVGSLGYFLFPQEEKELAEAPVNKDQTTISHPHRNFVKQAMKEESYTVKTDLYNSQEKFVPFSAISNISDLPDLAKERANKFIEESSSGIYFLSRGNETVYMISSLSTDEDESLIRRHDFKIVEISLNDGSIINNDKQETDSIYDTWTYENEFPITHSHFDNEKKLVYTEIWNYADKEPIKYKKTDGDGNIISLRKEVVDNDGTSLREENLFYDKDGNMTENVSFSYDGNDLTRFTYFNSNSPNDSLMIVSDYENGVKQKETVYSSDYKIKNTYLPDYKDGIKSQIKVLDEDNNLVKTLVEPKGQD